MQLERLLEISRAELAIPINENRTDLLLWEHSERVLRLCEVLATAPEMADQTIDLIALRAAAMFHDSGWAQQVRQGRIDRWQVLARPTNDLQRELGAAELQEKIGPLLPAKSARLGAEIIRQCNNRYTDVPEAIILSDAENLDEVGLLYALRQFRQNQAEGRSIEHMLLSWQRQREYSYWETRVRDGFRMDSVRQMARQRLAALEQFFTLLAREHRLEGEKAAVPSAQPSMAAPPPETHA